MGNQNSIQHDISIPHWQSVQVNNKRFAPREGATGATIQDKWVVFGGGHRDQEGLVDELDQLLIFTPSRNEWTELKGSIGEIPDARTGACSAVVGSNLYVFGGQTTFGWVNDLHVLNFETNEWRRIPQQRDTPSPRDKTGCVAIGSKIYFFGGFGTLTEEQLDELDEQDDRETLGENEEDEDEVDVESSSEMMSQAGPSVSFSWFQDLYIFDTATEKWTQVDNDNWRLKPSPRAAFGMAVFDQDKIFVFGGRDPEKRCNDLYIYDTTRNTWSVPASIHGVPPSARSFHTCSAIPETSKIVVFGGLDAESKHLNDIHVFDAQASAWYQPHRPQAEGPVIPARGFHVSAILGQSLYVFAGSANFDPRMNECTTFLDDTWQQDITPILNAPPLSLQTQQQPTTTITDINNNTVIPNNNNNSASNDNSTKKTNTSAPSATSPSKTPSSDPAASTSKKVFFDFGAPSTVLFN